jgi:inorganic pyrophosphatase/exopolyphosphatase
MARKISMRQAINEALDQEMAEWLASIAGVGIAEFGARMFAAGCAEEGMDPRKIIEQDLNVYE